MVIKNPPKVLNEMFMCAMKLGNNSVQYLGEGDWLVVSAKWDTEPYQLQTESPAGRRIMLTLTHREAVQCLAGVE